ncbi:MAG: HTTM domain-containing protein [Bdellovibrionales bacterium]
MESRSAAVLGRVTTKIQHYFFARFSFTPVVIARIVTGLCLFFFALQTWPYSAALYSLNGLAQGSLPFWGGVSGFEANLLVAAQLLFSLMVVVGLWTRISLVFLLIVQSALIELNFFAFWGWFHVTRHFLVFLFLADAGAKTSLDVLWFHKPARNDVGAWVYRLFQWQVSLVYLVAVVGRIGSSDWYSGNALGLALEDGVFSRLAFFPWLNYAPLLRPASYIGIFLEIGGGLLLFLNFSKKLRYLLIPGLLLFHLTLEVTTVVQYWQFIMAAGLLFYLPEIWRIPNLPNSPLSHRQAAVSLTLALGLAAVFINAWPVDLLPSSLKPLGQALKAPMAAWQLDATRKTNVFSSTRQRGRSCIFSAGLTMDGKLTRLYDPHDYCENKHYRFFHDELFTTVAKMSWRKSFSSLGAWLCRSAPSDPLRFVVHFERTQSLFLSNNQITRVPILEEAFTFNCKSQTWSDGISPWILSLIKDKYPYAIPF